MQNCGLRGLKDDLHTVKGLDSADYGLYRAANPDLQFFVGHDAVDFFTH